MSMKTWMAKSFKNNTWTVLGWVWAETYDEAWTFAIAKWGNLVSHVTDFSE